MLAVLANAPLYVIPLLVIVTVIITVHEFGHFAVARAFGVAIERFSIGFGRTLASWRDKSGVEWRIAWLPLGGYVRFAGDENIASVPDLDDLSALKREIVAREGPGAEQRYFFFKPLWQRALIVLAGPAINFLFAIVLLAVLVGCFGEPTESNRLGQVLAGSPAAAAGLRVGDEVRAIDGRPMATFEDLADYVRDRPGEPLVLGVQRGNQFFSLPVTTGIHLEKSLAGGMSKIGRLGVSPATYSVRHYNPIEAVGRGTTMTWTYVVRTGDAVARMVEGKTGWPFQGILGAAHVTGEVTKDAVTTAQTQHINLAVVLAAFLIPTTALLSISIGLANLLPIPVLDGGHLAFYAYEAVARRPLSTMAQAAGFRVGLALLAGLVLFTAWHDLQNMQLFHALGALFS